MNAAMESVPGHRAAAAVRAKIEQTRQDAATHTWDMGTDATTARDGLSGVESVRCSECGAYGRRGWFIDVDDALFSHGPSQRTYEDAMTAAGECTQDRRKRRATLLWVFALTIVCMVGVLRSHQLGADLTAVLWLCWMVTGWLLAAQTIALQQTRKVAWLRERAGERDAK